MTQRVLITGANGFIGTALTQRLLHDQVPDQHEVRAMCRQPSRGAVLAEGGAEVIYGDMQLPATLHAAVAGCTTVYHVGAALGGPAAYQYAVNVLGTIHLLQAAEQAGVRRFVHVSSIAYYGTKLTGRISENQRPTVTASDDSYMQTKRQAERYLWDFAAQSQMEITCVRPGMVYGPRSNFWTVQLAAAMRRFPLPIFGDGAGHAHPIYLDDVVDMLAVCGQHPNAIGQAFNCVPDPAPTWTEWLSYYARLADNDRKIALPTGALNAVAPIVDLVTSMRGETLNLKGLQRFILSNHTYAMDQAAALLDWRPHYSLEAGMQRTTEWLLQQPTLT